MENEKRVPQARLDAKALAQFRKYYEERGLEYEATAKVPGPSVDLRTLRGGELLRFLLDRGEGDLAVCQQCGGGVSHVESLPRYYRCRLCGGVCRPVDAKGWQRFARRVREACRRDSTLLPTIKAEWDAVHGDPETDRPLPLLRLPDAFQWLYDRWPRTGYPPGRRFNPTTHYRLAHAVAELERRGLSESEIWDVIRHPRGHRFARNRKRDFAKLGDEVLWQLGEKFRKEIGPWSKSKQELWRRVRWARRQWTDPTARLRSERVRARKSKAKSHRKKQHGR